MKEDRVKIWDYLKSIGVDLTWEQHDELKKLLLAHDESLEKERQRHIKELETALTKAKQTMTFLWKKANRK